jgi:hypothetical protein
VDWLNNIWIWFRRAPLGPAAVSALALAYMIAQWNVTIADVGDEGLALAVGWRIAMGQVPHADFFLGVYPVSFVPTALAFAIGGVGFVAARTLVIGLGIALLALCDRLICIFTRDPWIRSLALAFLTASGVMAWPIPSHHWVADLLQLAAALALLRGLHAPHATRWGMGAGVLTGLAVLSQQDQGGLFLLGLCVCVFPWIRDQARRRRLAAAWIGGGAAIALGFLLCVLPFVSPGELFYQTVTFPSTRYYGAAGQVTAFWDSWAPVLALSRADLATYPVHASGTALVPLLLNLLPYTAVAALAWALARSDERGPRLGVLAALVIAFLGSCARRYSVTYLVWAAPALLTMTAYGLDQLRQSGSAAARSTVRVVCGVLTVALLLYCASVAYHSRPTSPLTLTVPTRAGTIRMQNSPKAVAIRDTIAAIEHFVPPEAPLFTNGYLVGFNFLTLRQNPTRYDTFLYPELHTDAQALDARQALQASPDAAVLTEDSLDRGELGLLLRTHYAQAWRGHGLTLYVRTPTR